MGKAFCERPYALHRQCCFCLLSECYETINQSVNNIAVRGVLQRVFTIERVCYACNRRLLR